MHNQKAMQKFKPNDHAQLKMTDYYAIAEKLDISPLCSWLQLTFVNNVGMCLCICLWPKGHSHLCESDNKF